MGQKDLNFKAHISKDEYFADLFNGVLFHGDEIIRLDELEEAYGYLKQFAELVAEQKDSDITLSSDEFLSKVQKEHRFEPIILIVVYIGTKKEWDAQTCLHDIINIDNSLKPYVSNYRLNLFDYHDYNDFTIFKTANRVLFEALANKGNNKAFRKAMKNCDLYHTLSRETATTIKQLTGMKVDLETIKTVNENGEEEFDLCKAFEDERKIGKEEGTEENLRNLMKSTGTSALQAMDMLLIPKNKRKKYLKALSR